MAGGLERTVAAKPSAGRLTLVGTPIGNLDDLSPRAVAALSDADVICSEDTRVTGKLLTAFHISSRLERCDENVLAERIPSLLERMEAGERIAFVSDAGMPAVADPGARLVDACLDAGICVDVVPGPSAVTCAIAAVGFACEAFYFGGFLPRRDADRDALLQELADLPAVLVFYESPHRTAASLAAIARVFPERRTAMARELTKLHQEILRAPSAELAERIAQREDLKGEVVLLVDAPGSEERERIRQAHTAAAQGVSGEFDLDAAIRSGLASGQTKSALARDLAACCGLSRSEIYDRICELAGK